MKPVFAIVDWDQFVRPVFAYAGPDEIPKSMYGEIRRKLKKSRYGDDYTVERIVEIHKGCVSGYALQKACTDKGDGTYVFMVFRTYSDAVLAHELIHVIHSVIETTGVNDEEFVAYAMQWLFADFRFRLTGEWKDAVDMNAEI